MEGLLAHASVKTPGGCMIGRRSRRPSICDHMRHYLKIAFVSASVLLASPVLALPGSDLRTTHSQLSGREYWVELVHFPDHKARGAHAAIMVPKPPEQVLGVLRDVERFKEIFPQFVESRLLSRVGKNIEAHFE